MEIQNSNKQGQNFPRVRKGNLFFLKVFHYFTLSWNNSQLLLFNLLAKLEKNSLLVKYVLLL